MIKNRMYRVSDYKEGYNALDDLKTVGKELKRLLKGQSKEEAEEEERQKQMSKKKLAQQKVAEKYGKKKETSDQYDAKHEKGEIVTIKKKDGDTVDGEITGVFYDDDSDSVVYEITYDDNKTVNVPEKAIADSVSGSQGDMRRVADAESYYMAEDLITDQDAEEFAEMIGIDMSNDDAACAFFLNTLDEQVFKPVSSLPDGSEFVGSEDILDIYYCVDGGYYFAVYQEKYAERKRKYGFIG